MGNGNDYRLTFTEMMAYLDGVPSYPKTTTFTAQRLRQVTPEDVVRWINHKVFGLENPPDDATPTHRASSIGYWKKAISKHMVYQMMPWNPVDKHGNPTKSAEVNAIIKKVKKLEVRKVGAESQTRRATTDGEVDQTLTILRESQHSGPVQKYGMPAFHNFQIHMMARIDDVSQWRKDNFAVHDLYTEFAAKSKLRWSKNVNTEEDAPWQIILGSSNSKSCVFISIAIWLEWYFERGSPDTTELTPYVFDFNGDFRIPEGGQKAKAWVQEKLHDMYNGNEFILELEGKLGSHSYRKYARKRGRRSGASKDDCDYRGRWKREKRTSDVYEEGEIPYPDAKVAAMLCPGGACSYRIRENSPVTDDWILENVVPNITNSSYGRGLAKILGKALLYVCFSNNSHWVFAPTLERVKTAYNELMGDEINIINENPIEKRLLVITGEDSNLVITEVVPQQQHQPQQPQQPQQQHINNNSNLNNNNNNNHNRTINKYSNNNKCYLLLLKVRGQFKHLTNF